MASRFAARWRPAGAQAQVAMSSTPLALLVGTCCALLYLRWSPLSPDLAAQVARANVVHSAGNITWWTGWFGGVSMPNYSVLAPAWMAAFGVRASGIAAALSGAVAASVLVRDAARPRAGAVAFALAGIADLLAGRVTFVIGLSIAAWALVAVRARRGLIASALATVSYLASPLAALFLGFALLAVAAADETRRRSALVAAGLLLAVGASAAILFPGTGRMPFTVTDAIPPAICCVVVAVVCPSRVVRIGAIVALLALPLFLVAPGAVGGNVARLAWVCATPIVVACSRVSRPKLIAALLIVSVWPVSDLVEQLLASAAPSAAATYYAPLTERLAIEQAAAGTPATGERVEVVDTVNHWASVYLAGSASLARGWDRQADVADNPIFYTDGALTAASYRAWLQQLAVGWVAVPAAKLDYASLAERRLIGSGLPYLQLTWSTPRWQLFRVVPATPLAAGATVDAVSAGSITLSTQRAASVSLRVRWSSYLTVLDGHTMQPTHACISDAAGWTQLYLPAAGSYVVSSRFDPVARFRGRDLDCAADVRRK